MHEFKSLLMYKYTEKNILILLPYGKRELHKIQKKSCGLLVSWLGMCSVCGGVSAGMCEGGGVCMSFKSLVKQKYARKIY